MSHHGREDEREECTIGWHSINLNRYGLAVELIRAIAHGFCGEEQHMTVAQVADRWLEENGFECKATAQRQRDRRAAELDKEIARLQKEKEAL